MGSDHELDLPGGHHTIRGPDRQADYSGLLGRADDLAAGLPAWIMDRPLSQHWLIGVQLWRVIGGVFLIEMSRKNIPGIFAYPAGVGDLLVAGLAAAVLARYRNQPVIPRASLLVVNGFGIADFLSAFFFGFTSSPGPQQLFLPSVVNNSLLFPTGLIPLYLVPCRRFILHALSLLELRRDQH